MNMPFPKLRPGYTKLLLLNHAGALVTAGLFMIFAPASQYTTSSLHWNFEFLPRQAWGALFIIVSLLLYFNPKAWTGAVFSSAVLLWGVCLAAGVVTGHSASLSGWIWPTLTGLNMMLWTAFARFTQ